MKLISSLVSLAVCARAALYAPSSGVQLVDSAGVAHLGTLGQAYLVEFFADWCGHCQNFAPEYLRAATALQGVVTVAACNDDKAVQEHGVKGYPTVRLCLPETGCEQYNGPRTADSLVEFVTTRIQTAARRRLAVPVAAARPAVQTSIGGGRVIPLTAANFDRLVSQDRDHTWFVKFYAPWCGHCKAMAPAWTRLAQEVPPGVLIGEVDATVETALAQRYGVQSYPTLKVFTTTGAAVPYSGARDTASLRTFVSSYAPNVRMLHMRNERQFQELCENNTCFVAILPHIFDSSSAERKKYIKDLSAVANESKDLPYRYFWVQAGDNPALEEQLHLGFGWPALVAFKLSSNKFRVHRGTFSSQSLRQFIQQRAGAQWQELQEELQPWPEMPPWDGKDAERPTEPPTETDDEDVQEETSTQVNVEQVKEEQVKEEEVKEEEVKEEEVKEEEVKDGQDKDQQEKDEQEKGEQEKGSLKDTETSDESQSSDEKVDEKEQDEPRKSEPLGGRHGDELR